MTTYRTLDEAIELANAPGYGLSSSIYTTDPQEAFTFRDGIGAGMVSINNSTSGAEAHLPFGGNGKSGNGSRQSGIWVLDQFTRWQAVNWDYSGRLQKAQMDVAELTPDTDFRLELIMVTPATRWTPTSARLSARIRASTCAELQLAQWSEPASASGSSESLVAGCRGAGDQPAPGLRGPSSCRQQGRGFYTIGSAGHESNALVALALRPSDPALLHYRSGGVLLSPGAGRCRGRPGPRRAAGTDGAGRRADRRRPAQGVRPPGRWRSSRRPRPSPRTCPGRSGWPSPCTGRTGCGVAVASGRADAVVVCSFGDASANHSTATGAINTALNAAFRGLPVPILFVCEDNGLGHLRADPGRLDRGRVRVPARAELRRRRRRPTRSTAVGPISEAVRTVREQRRPVFLHLRTVRFLGHAGSDAEISYRRTREIAADYDRDPLLGTARALLLGAVRRHRPAAREVRADPG